LPWGGFYDRGSRLEVEKGEAKREARRDYALPIYRQTDDEI